MFDFQYPIHLCLMASLAVVFLLFLWARLSRKAKIRRFGDPQVLSALMPDASRYKPSVKIILELLALAAIVVVLARPRAGERQEVKRSEGIEVMIAFDVSNSMLASANDDPGGTSRLTKARLLLDKMLGRLDNDKVGLVVFAGQAKTQLPLTYDFNTVKLYLNELTPQKVTFQGTSITDAINLSAEQFSKDNEQVGKAIILITDAEDHEGDAVEAARLATENGIQVNVVGVGGPKGMPIPMTDGGSRYLMYDGEEVRTSFNEQAAKDIAAAGKGIYVNGSASNALDQLMESLDNLDKVDLGTAKYKTSAEQFPVFAWIALALLVIDVFILDRKIGWLKKVNFFTRKAVASNKAKK